MDLQKARLARIRLAKATSGAAFLSKKRAVESRLLAQESGLGMDENGEDHWLREEDIFELQHHHLLRCLEKATVSCSASFDYWPDTCSRMNKLVAVWPLYLTLLKRHLLEQVDLYCPMKVLSTAVVLPCATFQLIWRQFYHGAIKRIYYAP